MSKSYLKGLQTTWKSITPTYIYKLLERMPRISSALTEAHCGFFDEKIQKILKDRTYFLCFRGKFQGGPTLLASSVYITQASTNSSIRFTHKELIGLQQTYAKGATQWDLNLKQCDCKVSLTTQPCLHLTIRSHMSAFTGLVTQIFNQVNFQIIVYKINMSRLFKW